MTGYCIAHGLRTTGRNPALMTLLWFGTTVLSAAAAFPAWLWLGRGFDLAPESDHLLTGFSFTAIAELGQYDRSPVPTILMSSLLAAVFLAFLANPLVSGGLVEALIAKEEATTLRRFMRGAGCYYWRFLRLLVYAVVTAAVAFGLIAAGFAPLGRKLSESPWEPAPVIGSLVQGAVLLIVGGIILLTLDFARVRLAVDDSRRALRSWMWALGMVTRRLPSTLPLLLVPVAIFVLLVGIYLTYVRSAPSDTAWFILILFLLQQALMFCRASLRVSVVSSVLEFQCRLPRPDVPATIQAPDASMTIPAPGAVDVATHAE